MTDKPELVITSLDWREYSGTKTDIPYLVVNCTFKITPDSHLWQSTKRESDEYIITQIIDDPKRYDEWIESEMGFGKFKYPGWGRAWTMQDQVWQYLRKFDTFWLREWVTDCGVVRESLKELEYYQKTGKTIWNYRNTEACTILRHLRTLNAWWD